MISLQNLARHALHALLPITCGSCGVALGDDPVPFFCRSCWAAIRPLRGACCPRCGHPFPSRVALTYSPRHVCGDCRKRRPAFTQAWSLYPYEGPLRDAIHLFKYRGKVVLRTPLVGLMQTAWRETPRFDLVMPVPLHPSRLREREFNQALLLGDQISCWARVPLVYDNLVRRRETTPQTGLTQTERRKNLRRCFALERPGEVVKKRVLLVDDVFTTGTTVNECAKVLRKAGSGDVYVVTLARTI